MEQSDPFPLTRATFYPPANGDELPDPQALDVTSLIVDIDVEEVDQVTIATENMHRVHAGGVEFDLEPDEARNLAGALMEAADKLDFLMRHSGRRTSRELAASRASLL